MSCCEVQEKNKKLNVQKTSAELLKNFHIFIKRKVRFYFSLLYHAHLCKGWNILLEWASNSNKFTKRRKIGWNNGNYIKNLNSAKVGKLNFLKKKKTKKKEICTNYVLKVKISIYKNLNQKKKPTTQWVHIPEIIFFFKNSLCHFILIVHIIK